MTHSPLHIVGAGLAGSEAAWLAAEAGVQVVLHEMRPHVMTDAHKTGGAAELVCSNSFRSDDVWRNAVGLLHEEMRRCGSLIMRGGDRFALPAGGALAVDRDQFSAFVTQSLEAHPRITLAREEVNGPPPEEWQSVIIATGPLTSPGLAEAIRAMTGSDQLAFFDAIAPIVTRESVNMDIAWLQSRYDKPGPHGTGKDYINCPLSEAEYNAFIDALLAAEVTEFRDWEKNTPYFEGCMPIEEMARRGRDTPRFGPMKPLGLTDPRTGKQPYAAVQLRQDNALGTLYNIVGFQTKMRYGAQTQVLRMIPGLESAAFARLGGLHRNTFINAPLLLDPYLRLKTERRIRFAGQITGCEGYVESAAVGLVAGRLAAAELRGEALTPPPPESATGALVAHITGGADPETYQPMNINYGLFPPLEGKIKKKDKKEAITRRALAAIDAWAVSKPDEETSALTA